MIIYNTTVKIERKVHREWLSWMKEVHIPDILACDEVSDYRIYRLLMADPDNEETYAFQLFFPDLQALQAYLSADGILHQRIFSDRYRDRYVAFSTVMENV
jgi:Domain of unknown function (DUF4286)